MSAGTMTMTGRRSGARSKAAEASVAPARAESLAHFARLGWMILKTPPPPSGHLTALTHGHPGGGKTTVWKAISRGLGVAPAHHYTMAAAQRNPEDLGGGWGVPRADGLVFEPPAMIRRLSECGAPAMIVLDEAGNADRARQAAMLRLIHERTCGDYELNGNVMMVMITNPPESGTDPHEAARALSNRTVSLAYPDPSPNEFLAYMQKRGAAEFAFPEWDEAAFWKEYEMAVAIFAGFINKGLDAKLSEDPESDEVAARWPCNYATPRTWETAIRLYATTRAMGAEDDALILLPGTVGGPQAMAFLAAARDMDLRSFAEVCENPRCFKPDPLKPDRTFAQLHLVASAGADRGFKGKDLGERWDAAMRFLDWIAVGCDQEPALCVVAGQILAEYTPPGTSLAKHSKVILKLEPYVRAAGWRV